MAKDKTKPAKKSSADEDGRRDVRVPLKARVDYELMSEDTFLFEYTSNLSRGGIFLATRNPLPVGTQLNLRFALPEEKRTIETTGQVVWVNEYRPGGENINPGMGIEFVDLVEKDRNAITRLIKRKAMLAD
jgi:uncharacterized protein (TIGR02266 family)